MVDFSIFNELSLPLRSLSEFDEFFKILTKLRDLGFEKIRMDRRFTQYPEILPNTTFQQLLGQLTDPDKKRRLKSFINNGITVIQSPLIKEDESESEKLLENEYFYDGKSTIGGLACCEIWDSVAVSFNSSVVWDKGYITLQKQTLQLTKLIDVQIKNISLQSHIEFHSDFFKNYQDFIQSNITRNNFFENKEKLFKNRLIICDEVEKQIKNIDTKIFSQAISILLDLDSGKKSIEDFNISGEGETVKNTPSLRAKREFLVVGKKEFFQKHIKNLSDGYRIHFFEKDKKIYIGYIGKHLPTKNFS